VCKITTEKATSDGVEWGIVCAVRQSKIKKDEKWGLIEKRLKVPESHGKVK